MGSETVKHDTYSLLSGKPYALCQEILGASFSAKLSSRKLRSLGQEIGHCTSPRVAGGGAAPTLGGCFFLKEPGGDRHLVFELRRHEPAY